MSEKLKHANATWPHSVSVMKKTPVTSKTCMAVALNQQKGEGTDSIVTAGTASATNEAGAGGVTIKAPNGFAKNCNHLR